MVEGRFRADLYYRLNAATLALPPLRARWDFDALDYMLDRIGTDHAVAYHLTVPARRTLRRYSWPGNLRELRNMLEVAAALCDRGSISPDVLPDAVRQAQLRSGELEEQLAACGGNVSELARQLGVDRSTIHRRLKRDRAS